MRIFGFRSRGISRSLEWHSQKHRRALPQPAAHLDTSANILKPMLQISQAVAVFADL
jgi:hypothetical protein